MPIADLRRRRVQAGTEAAERLAAAGLKPSRARVRVLEAVSQAATVLTPDAVFQALGNVCSRGSTYRTMAELHRAGLLSRYRLVNGGVAYALHEDRLGILVVCTGCDTTQVIDDPRAWQHVKQVVHRIGFQVADGTLHVNGLCPDCQVRQGKHLGRCRYPLKARHHHDRALTDELAE
jgi:Fe2+ or Zn2+ uptake regulation protein